MSDKWQDGVEALLEKINSLFTSPRSAQEDKLNFKLSVWNGLFVHSFGTPTVEISGLNIPKDAQGISRAKTLIDAFHEAIRTLCKQRSLYARYKNTAANCDLLPAEIGAFEVVMGETVKIASALLTLTPNTPPAISPRVGRHRGPRTNIIVGPDYVKLCFSDVLEKFRRPGNAHLCFEAPARRGNVAGAIANVLKIARAHVQKHQ